MSPGPTAAWTFLPLVHQRKLVVGALCGVLAVFLLVAWVTSKPYLGAIIALLGAVTVWRLFVPVHFQIDKEGITQRVWRRSGLTAWSAIRSLELSDEGLSIQSKSALGEFSGLRRMMVPWGSHRDEVLACIEFHAPYLRESETNEVGTQTTEGEQTHTEP